MTEMLFPFFKKSKKDFAMILMQCIGSAFQVRMGISGGILHAPLSLAQSLTSSLCGAWRWTNPGIVCCCSLHE
eukprot:14213855-Ditylum_brightwellii.AAC.1